MNQMTIDQLTRETGLTKATLLFYEKCGLINEPEKSQLNHRVYNREDVERLSFVDTAKGLGFTLEDIREMLELRRREHSCR